MNILLSITPIFVVILLGLLARRWGFLPDTFGDPANRLVYYLAIPAMIFRAIAKTSFYTAFNGKVLVITLLCTLAGYIVARLAAALAGVAPEKRGAFTQASFHGNLGYIGLAVALFYLGHTGFVQAGILAGFIMILQNFLAVVVLQPISVKVAWPLIAYRLIANPVILSALGGILFSLSGITFPLILDRTLAVIGNMALPLALLLIGSSLSLERIRSRITCVLQTVAIKLMVMPAIGFLLYGLAEIPTQQYLPGLILLASPTATLAYIMARQMDGDTDMAVAAISASTLVSAGSYWFWLSLTA